MSVRPCSKCGNVVSIGDAFCKSCGNDMRGVTSGFSSSQPDPNNPLVGYAAKLNEGVVMQTAAATKIASNVGRTVIIVTILSLVAAGAMAFFIMRSVSDVTNDVTGDVNESLRGAGGLIEEANDQQADAQKFACEQELGTYLQVLITTKGTNNGGLDLRFEKSSPQYKTTYAAYETYKKTKKAKGPGAADRAADKVIAGGCAGL